MVRNARAMIDVDYAGSPPVVDFAPGLPGPRPGQWYPDWTRLGGVLHSALIFGPVPDGAALATFERRWRELVQVSRDPAVDPVRAGVTTSGGVVLIRPDGHIGFRFASAGADALAALDSHLASYLLPAAGSGH